MDRDFVSVHKNAKRELGQYPAILTLRLVKNIYILRCNVALLDYALLLNCKPRNDNMNTLSCCIICQGIKGESGPSGPPGLQGVQASGLSPTFSDEQCFSIPTLVRIFFCSCVYPILRPGLALREGCRGI